MRGSRLAIAIAAAIVSAAVVAGCGDSTPEVTKEALTQPTDTAKFQGMMDQMKGSLKADRSGKPAIQ